jgi:DNA invertase Pin-like site-specific DNA recombinase
MSRAPKRPERPDRATTRCAIYTRKSTEEGLEQEFNSLDAQRESAEAYIASQRAEGWMLLPDRYDDGGYSGGSMERPALDRLLRDITDGKVDCVVVYKVDRLSRSLMDFARMMEVFERHGVSFVSVTQQFNTTHSMGRLTLNILLSFAQFEREIISERIRDKLAAQARKGKWTGGALVLGYDVDRSGPNPHLVVNASEAAHNLPLLITVIAEHRDGYPHRLRAIGHLHEAEDVSQTWPELHDAIRAALKAYQQTGAMPDFATLAQRVATLGPPAQPEAAATGQSVKET